MKYLMLIVVFAINYSFAKTSPDSLKPAGEVFNRLDYGKIEIRCGSDSLCRYFINTSALYEEGLDTIPQTKFWQTMISFNSDSGVVSTISTRRIFFKLSFADWQKLGEEKQQCLRDSIRTTFGLDSNERIVYTRGKKDFYDVPSVVPQIDKAIEIFEEEKVDPFYAQAILLIESPGRLQKSVAGAYGPFQLMRKVAVKQGLTVNKYIDERKDLEKSAHAAAKLIRTICIPYTNAMLDKRCITHYETDLWYRLLLLHVYHAGAGNVEKALAMINPELGNMDMIKILWNTSAGDFKNSSQNYSQVAITMLLELDKLLNISKL